ncbi:MAG: LPS-assembly protein LptD [Nitrospirae bacterium]|nr:LPS-assembly protein LptD [Nitrospirota bacterium]
MTGGLWSFQRTSIAAALLFSLLPCSPTSAQLVPHVSSHVKSNDQPIEITAEQIEYLKDEDRYIADGSVNVIQGSVHLTADHVVLDNQTGLVKASGHVVLQDKGDVLSSDRLDYNLQTKTGTAVPGQLFARKVNYHIQAAQMDRSGESHYELRTWSATSCDADEGETPSWRFRGRTARVDLGQYLVARDVVFYVRGIPVFYAPYLVLSMKTTRQSGLLIPRFGYNTVDGLRVNQDLFLALGPSQDATLTLDYRAIRGTGAGLEYRYKLSRGSEGQLHYTIFDDHITASRRSETTLSHVQRFTTDFQARLNVHLISDVNQLRDLSSTTADRLQQSLESTFVIFRRWDNQDLSLSARLTRDLVTRSNTTLQELPKASYVLREYRLGDLPLYTGLDATAVNFWRENVDAAAGLIRAVRLDAFPRIWTRLNLGGIVLTPRAGYRETWYSRDLVSDSPTRRGLEILDLGANTRLTKRFESSGSGRLVHFIEPAVVYDYVPRVDQANLPHFDDIDQLPRKNSVTYSLTNRLVWEEEADPEKPASLEWIFWKLTQSYDIHAKRLEGNPGPAHPFSNLRSESILRPSTKTSLDIDTFYDLSQRKTVSFNSDLHLQVLNPWEIGVGQRYTREGAPGPNGDPINPLSPPDRMFWYSQPSPLLRFLTMDTKIVLLSKMTLTARVYYDVKDQAIAETDYGLRYIGQCWGIDLSYQILPDRRQWGFLITLRPEEMSRASTIGF